MNREEFIEWIHTCPTDGWRVVSDSYGFVHVAYGIEEEQEWVNEGTPWTRFKLGTVWFLFGGVVSVGASMAFISAMTRVMP